MKFISATLALATLFVTEAIALPSPDTAQLSKRAQRNPVVGLTDGVNTQTGQRPYRLELNTFVKNADQLNLFLLGLQAMYSTSYSNPVSFYDIAGIHGRPYIGWNGEGATGNSESGYCTHGSALFPTWHRPYLALYEQSLHAAMAAQVAKFPAANQARWQAALTGFRVPYWDWATNNAQMPSILTTATWTVTTTANQKASIANPLYSFNFPGGVSRTDLPDSPFYLWKTTLRYPTSQKSTAVSQDSKVNQQLAQNAASLQQRMYSLFTDSTYKSYAAISNTASNVNAPDSLESVHNTIHGLTGNGGHMSYIDYSAFDPIFFLHHANIDRMFAIWQALYPTSWLTTGQQNPFGTYGEPVGTIETATTGLTPFRSTNGALYTSNSVRQMSTFGYSYPEIPDWNYKTNPAGLTAYVKKQVQTLYGGTSASIASAASKMKRDVDGGNSTATAIGVSVVDDTYYDWKVDVHTNKFVLGGSYFVHIFLGEPSSDPAQWSMQPELVGDYVVFANKMSQQPHASTVCGVPKNLVSGSVPLTHALLDKIATIGSLNPSDVVDYLTKHLTWRISLMDDCSVEVDQVCDLKITVAAAQVTLPKEVSTFPVYAPYQFYADITGGKAGGAYV